MGSAIPEHETSQRSRRNSATNVRSEIGHNGGEAIGGSSDYWRAWRDAGHGAEGRESIEGSAFGNYFQTEENNGVSDPKPPVIEATHRGNNEKAGGGAGSTAEREVRYSLNGDTHGGDTYSGAFSQGPPDTLQALAMEFMDDLTVSKRPSFEPAFSRGLHGRCVQSPALQYKATTRPSSAPQRPKPQHASSASTAFPAKASATASQVGF